MPLFHSSFKGLRADFKRPWFVFSHFLSKPRKFENMSMKCWIRSNLPSSSVETITAAELGPDTTVTAATQTEYTVNFFKDEIITDKEAFATIIVFGRELCEASRSITRYDWRIPFSKSSGTRDHVTTIEVELRLYALTLPGAALGAKNSKHTFMSNREGLFDLKSGFFHPTHNSWYHKINKDKMTDHHTFLGNCPPTPPLA